MAGLCPLPLEHKIQSRDVHQTQMWNGWTNTLSWSGYSCVARSGQLHSRLLIHLANLLLLELDPKETTLIILINKQN